MSKVVIKGKIAGAPAPETQENYTRYEMPVIVDGQKEPVFVELYGMRDLPKRYPAESRVNIIAERRTGKISDGIRTEYSNIYAVERISRV